MFIKTYIARRPVLTYFALTFVITWSGILFTVGLEGLRDAFQDKRALGERVDGQAALVFLAMILGPSLASVLLTSILEGREGLGCLLSRIVRWRVGLRWYALALLITPVLATLVLSALMLVSSVFVPGILTASDAATLVVAFIVLGVVAGLFEEIGWTGFALPRIQREQSSLTTGVIIGVLWTAWHLLADAWMQGGYYGAHYPLHFLVYGAFMTAARLVIVWMYDHSDSIMLVQLMHASFTSSLLILSPSAASAADAVLWHSAFAATLWVVVALVTRAKRKRFVEQPIEIRADG